MEKVIDLKDLLKHEITDLYSAEEQIIEALPLMIEKAGNAKLKAALEEHLKVTENQKLRLDEIKQLLIEVPEENNGNAENTENVENAGDTEDTADTKKPGFFSRLFGGGVEKCKGMEGLISEGQKVMSTDMSPEASDAAIIASAQKIEHYEICGYGTARAFARELNLGEVANLLEQTLNEEYFADNLLTDLAVGKINVDAEFADGSENGISPAKRAKPRPAAKSGNKPVKSAVKRAGVKKVSKGNTGAKSPAKSSAFKSKLSKSPLKSPSPKSGSSPAKGKGKSVSPGKAAVKLKASVKKVAAKSSKPGGSKSPSKIQSPAKSKSSRRR